MCLAFAFATIEPAEPASTASSTSTFTPWTRAASPSLCCCVASPLAFSYTTLQLLHSCLTFFSKSGLSCASYRGVWSSGSSSAILGPPPPPAPPAPPPPQPAATRPARASSDTIAAPGLLRLRHRGCLLLVWLSVVMSWSFRLGTGVRRLCSTASGNLRPRRRQHEAPAAERR